MENLKKAFSFIKGNIEIKPYICDEKGKKIDIAYHAEVNEKYSTVHISSESSLWRDDWYINYNDNETICKRVTENISGKTLKIKESGFTVSGIDFGKDTHDDYFYHPENARIYETLTFPIDYSRDKDSANNSEFDVQAGTKWADAEVVSERIGASPYQPFPAILIGNYKSCYGIVHGTLSQKIFFHNYLLKHENGTVTLDVLSSFKDVGALEAENGRILTDEWYFGKTDHAENFERIFENYTPYLRKRLAGAAGKSEANRKYVSWGSWNDGIFRNVSEELILKEARFLRKNFPTVKWIQLDDGYSHMKKIAHGLGVPYEGNAGIDSGKFPHGLRYYTDEIRKLGLHPSIWVGGFCPCDTPIYKEHPEWFIDYTYRISTTQPLDVSIDEVREYMKNAIKKLVLEYGFDGVKHDFWSYAFEDSHDLYKNRNRSGYENRRWWLRTIRDCIPEDGYLQTGCDLVMANPFLSEFFTNYRYGIDISGGNWEYVKTSMQWGAVCFATHTGDLFAPNSDSIGLLPSLSETEAMFCINYCMTTHSLVEIAGKLSESKDENRLKNLKKAVCNPNNGQDVYFVGFDYRRSGRSIPQIMYFKTPHFSCKENAACMPVRTVGFFNIDEEKKTFTVKLSDMGLSDGKYIATDVWSGESFEFKTEFSVSAEAHGSRLIAVSRCEGIQLLDANVRILSAESNENSITFETDYASDDAELLFNRAPKKLLFDGEILPCIITGGKAECRHLGKGTVIAEF